MSEQQFRNPIFQDDDAARALLEKLRWPNGAICVRNLDHTEVVKIGGSKHSHRKGLYVCLTCRAEGVSAQFTVTVGTMLERTRVPIRLWLQALRVWSANCSSIQDVHLSTGVTYKTAWQMWERVEAAARLYKGQLRPFTGTKVGDILRAKQSKSVARGLYPREAELLRQQGKHPAQHTIKAEGVLSSTVKLDKATLDRTEALTRLMLATDPNALDKFKKHKKRKTRASSPSSRSRAAATR